VFTTSAIVAITDEKCVGCQRCVNVCPSGALTMSARLAVLDEPRCVGCFKCVEACHPYDAISVLRDPNPRQLTTPITDEFRPAVEELCATARLDPDAVICLCTSTTAGEVAAAVLGGVHEPEDLALATGVRAKCGMWCLTPAMRLLRAHGVEITRPARDQRIYADGDGAEVAIWTISDEVADRYPEYRLREDLDAIERDDVPRAVGFPDIRPAHDRERADDSL
jgi:Fe-S-cluster-containing hydrogenase component 2